MAQPATGSKAAARSSRSSRCPSSNGAGIVLSGPVAVSGIRTLSQAGPAGSSGIVPGAVPLAAPAFHADLPAREQTVLGSGISAGALVAVLLTLSFHPLGTRSRPAAALKFS